MWFIAGLTGISDGSIRGPQRQPMPIDGGTGGPYGPPPLGMPWGMIGTHGRRVSDKIVLTQEVKSYRFQATGN
jgi:hypothetical protein